MRAGKTHLAATRERVRRLGAVASIGSTVALAIYLCLPMACGTSPKQKNDIRVFIGASITERWPQYADFISRGWVGRGISGQTSSDVLARFNSDVIAVRPDAVHILCGTNDMRPGYTPAGTIANYKSMIGKSKAAGIKVFIGTIPPWGYGPAADSSPTTYPTRNDDVNILNAEIGSLALDEAVTVIDYHSVLVGPDGRYNPAYTDDGIHPNTAGFARMTALADSVVPSRLEGRP